MTNNRKDKPKKIDTDVYDIAITPVMVKDKHGNIWNMDVTRCNLILRKNDVI